MRSKTGLVVAAGMLAGCMGGNIAQMNVDRLMVRPARSELVLVKQFDTSTTIFTGDKADEPHVVESQRVLVRAAISGQILKKLGSRGYNVRSYSEGQGQALIIDGVVTHVNHGSGALRYLIGFGAGSAWIKANVRIYSSSTPYDILADFVAEGSTTGGVQDHTMVNAEEIAAAIVDYLESKPQGVPGM